MNAEIIIKEKKGTIVDVRTSAEYKTGHVEGSINIPIQEFQQRISELKSIKQPIVVCCASGGRSGQAVPFLMQQGIICYNGGSWLEVKHHQKKVHH
ncbi:MAG: rhodanese-like domain-containing protein [Saprospiraceae bacterium]